MRKRKPLTAADIGFKAGYQGRSYLPSVQFETPEAWSQFYTAWKAGKEKREAETYSRQGINLAGRPVQLAMDFNQPEPAILPEKKPPASATPEQRREYFRHYRNFANSLKRRG